MKARLRRAVWPALGCVVVVTVALCYSATSGFRRESQTKHRSIGRWDVDPDTSCGPVSLAVVSHYLGRPVPIAAFHEATGAGALGVCSISDLIGALRQKGFACTALRYDPRRPPSHDLPMVLFVDGAHFLVALPGGKNTVVLVDPPSKSDVATCAQLAVRWQGEAVVVAMTNTDLSRALEQDGAGSRE